MHMSLKGNAPNRRGELLARATQVRADIDAFNARWPPLAPGDAAPTFAWEALERQLVDLAPSELQAELVRGLVERVRSYSPLKPAEMVLREILGVAALVLEDSPLEPD
jgi:hypothetical protein